MVECQSRYLEGRVRVLVQVKMFLFKVNNTYIIKLSANKSMDEDIVMLKHQETCTDIFVAKITRVYKSGWRTSPHIAEPAKCQSVVSSARGITGYK